MQSRFAKILLFNVLMLTVLVQNCLASNSGTVTISASVYVSCQFSVALASQNTAYIYPFNIIVTYSVKTLNQCNIPSASGNFVIANALTNQVFYSNTLTLTNLSPTPTNGVFTVNSQLSSFGLDTATFTVSTKNVTNSSSVQFEVGSPANVFITSVSATNPSTQGSVTTIVTGATNDGSLASSNMILQIQISGPNSFIFTANQPISSLSPGQSESVSVTLGGVTQDIGNYNILENISYQSTFTQNGITYPTNLISNNAQTNYSVVAQAPTQSGGHGGIGSLTITPIVTNIGQLTFSQMPLYSTVSTGNNTVTIVGFHNNGNSPIWVNITIPKLQNATIGLSANSIFMLANQTGIVQIYFSSPKNASATSYIVPINFTVTAVGAKPAYGQLYTGLRIRSSVLTTPAVLRSTSLTGAKTVVTQLSVYNPTANTLFNTVISTMIPATILSNKVNIVLSGGVHNVSLFDNQYILEWRIPVIQPHSTGLLSYSITNVSSPQYFYQPITSITTISPTNATELRVFNILIPTFFVNSPENITVSSIYTGTNETNLTFTLVPPLGTIVKNQVQHLKVFPNTVLETRFNISAPTRSGTEIFRLIITGPFSNQSYTLPVVVLQNQTVVPTNSQQNTIQSYEQYAIIIVIIAGIIVLLTAGLIIRKRLSLPKYNRDRAEKMLRIRQRVKREFGDE